MALKGIVDKNIYQNNIDYANELLKYFVRTFINIYGVEHVSHNIHSLLYIAGDTQIYGSIENLSALPLENNMLFLKRLPTSSTKILF